MANQLYNIGLSALDSKNALQTANKINQAASQASVGQVMKKAATGFEFGSGSSLPESSVSDAGKVLCVGDDGNPFWYMVPEAGGNSF